MSLEVFQYNQAQVRIVKDDQGEPWWVAKDVCEYFGDSDHKRSVARLDGEDKTLVEVVDSLGRPQQAVAVNESGLYALLFGFQPDKSRKDGGAQTDPHVATRLEKIRDFKRWITHEVLPSIRKHGLYATPATVEAMLNDPDVMIQALTALKEERIKRAALEEERKALLPKAEFFDQIADSKDAVDMGRAAKVLNCGIGRNRLFALLRDKGVLMDNNMPYQWALDKGYFRVIEQKWTKPDGSTHVSFRTLVYQRGLAYLRRLVQGARKAA
jgi:anti-repressor protein